MSQRGGFDRACRRAARRKRCGSAACATREAYGRRNADGERHAQRQGHLGEEGAPRPERGRRRQLHRLVRKLLAPFREVLGNVAAAVELVLVDHEPLNSHRAARVDAVCAHANLRAKSVTLAVGEARRRVDVDSGRIDETGEVLGGGGRLRHDGVGVVRRVRVDVLDRFLDGRDGLDGDGELEELRVEVDVGGGEQLVGGFDVHVRSKRCEAGGVAAQRHALGEKRRCDGAPGGAQGVGVE
mmetsp:Transcript_56031/g.121970  ORF Transcript_56031/g.121970 Transcript_56031/m.121970 type:complete len:241 (+) Transcript_56031:131-853(+)